MPTIDLSHPISPEMPVYPGDPVPRFTTLATVGEDGYLYRELVIGSHIGTHIDAPAHMIAGAKTLDALPVSTFVGPAYVLSLPVDAGTEIGLAALRPHEAAIAAHDFVLLNTGWHRKWGTAEYFDRFPTLTVDAARWLVGLNIKGIGLDTPSADPIGAAGHAVHLPLLEAGLVIVENLTNLDELPETVTFAALPLPLAGADGSPVRAIATW